MISRRAVPLFTAVRYPDRGESGYRWIDDSGAEQIRVFVEGVEEEVIGEIFHDRLAANAVALLVESRAEHADAVAGTSHRDNAAAYTALGGQATSVMKP